MTEDERRARMLLPWDPPLPVSIGAALPAIPSLWDRAKLFFGRVLKEIGSTAGLSKRWKVSRKERREILGWFHPVECLVRSCLIVKAIAFLTMTPEGRKLMRDTPRMPMPDWPRPEKARDDGYVATIPHPGWHTIAAHRNALVERQKQEAARAAEIAARRAATDRHDPSSWSCPLRCVGWTFPGDETEPAPPKQSSPWATILDPDVLCPDPLLLGPARKPSPPAPKDRPALKLARRIEAVARVLADPGKATYRLARYLARLPLEALEGLTEAFARIPPWWKHGFAEARHVQAHLRRASTVLLYRESG